MKFTLDRRQAMVMGSSRYVYGWGSMPKGSFDEINSLIDEMIEECPERIVSASATARATRDEVPNVRVRFSMKAEMVGMAEWLTAKLRDWYYKKTGLHGAFDVVEGAGVDRFEVRMHGQDLSDMESKRKKQIDDLEKREHHDS